MASLPPRSVEGLDCVLVWLRRDLRLYDNPALVCALQSAKRVIPIFIHAPEEEGQFQLGRTARWWLKQTLQNLSSEVERLGSRLIVRRSPSGEALPTILELLRETGAQGLFFNHLYDAISLTRDHDVKVAVEAAGLMCRSFNSELLYEPWEVLDEADEPFVTFMDFWNRVITMPHPPSYPLPPPNWMPAVPAEVAGQALDDVDFFQSAVQEGSVAQLKHRWDASTASGHLRLEAFLDKMLPLFDHDRAKVDRSSTSQMSPWLHVGSVSERYIYYRVVSRHAELLREGQDCTASCLQFLQQLGYREYSRYLSFHFPFIAERSLLAHLRACPCRLDQNRFKAWKKGQTGYPLVDAAMRQLWSNGWVHNRLRVVVSSFLVKNLLLPWQWGLKHMWDAQIDADLEMDALGWQYVSGCLIDGHPFNFMIDLDAESKRFDPDGQYVRQWLPVLALLPNEFVHHPWRAPADLLEEAGVEIGFNFPAPIVSLKESQRDVQWADSVIQRCCSTNSGGNNGASQPAGGSSGSGNNANNNGGGSGNANNSNEPAATGHKGGGNGGAVVAVPQQPHKQPYRPPTDPAIQAAFLKIPGGSGAGSGSIFEALHGVVPDLVGLRLPEHLYRRTPVFDSLPDRTPRRASRRHGAVNGTRSGAVPRIAGSQHSGAAAARTPAAAAAAAPPDSGFGPRPEHAWHSEIDPHEQHEASGAESGSIAGDSGSALSEVCSNNLIMKEEEDEEEEGEAGTGAAGACGAAATGNRRDVEAPAEGAACAMGEERQEQAGKFGGGADKCDVSMEVVVAAAAAPLAGKAGFERLSLRSGTAA